MTVWTSALTPGIEFEVIMLTPELAKEYLEHLPERQRAQSERSVDRYASDLLAGQFPFTGDPIRFNGDGELIDGQHRCTAVMESGESMPVLVIRNLDAEMIRFFDGGRSRKFHDDLRIAGYANHIALSALTSRVWHYEHGNYGYMNVPFVQNPVYANTAPTRAQLHATLAAHPELVETATSGQRIRSYLPNIPTSVVGFTWWLLGVADIDAREKFFHELIHGSEVNGAEYPINVLRRLATRRVGPQDEREGHIWIAYIVKAYNAWAQGRSISYLRMPVPLRWNTLPLPIGIARPGIAVEEETAGDEE